MWPDILLKSLISNFGNITNLRKAISKSILRAITGAPCVQINLNANKADKHIEIIKKAFKQRSIMLVQN